VKSRILPTPSWSETKAAETLNGRARAVPPRGRTLNSEVTVIKKVSGGYKVLSEKGKNLGGPYKSKAAAEKRLKQVEFFKHKG
jgi:hypothetical protein